MTLRKIVFWAHLAAGVVAGLFIANAALTGAVLAFDPQIVPLAERGVRRVAPGAARKTLDEVVASAVAAAPSGAAPRMVIAFADPAASAIVSFGREGKTLFVDPYTAAVLGEGSKVHDFLHAVEDWHRWLWSKETGRPVTGAACAAFFLMVLTGVYLWWPRKMTRLAARSAGKARDFNWHNVLGFWFAPLLLLTTATGVVIAYEWANNLVYRIAGDAPPPKREDGRGGKDAGAPPAPAQAPFEAFYKEAAGRVDGWDALTLRMPQKPGGPVTASLRVERAVGPDHNHQLTMDWATAAPGKWEPYGSLGRGRRARMWIKPLHTGEAFGIVGQAAMFLASLAALVLVWTGLALSWRRFFAKNSA